jgi:AIPR protein
VVLLQPNFSAGQAYRHSTPPMSIIHVNQIKTQVTRQLSAHLDLSDATRAPADMQEALMLSRGLAAYALMIRAAAPPETAAAAVTDGGQDNGLDAIYFDESNKRLYLVQSKWIRDGSGEPENGDIKKFVAGVRDLFNGRMDRFNDRVRAKEPLITAALQDPASRYEVIVAYTGSNRLSEPSARDLADLAEEFNDISEVLFTTVLDQTELHRSLTAAVAGEPIGLQVGLKAWGRKESPKEAFYGQVSADQIGQWWTQYRQRLFAKNLRGTLPDSDVNAEIRSTLEQHPSSFWYFNNGITMVARSIARPMAGGGGTDFATFHYEDISVVNGAQTVSAIGAVTDAGGRDLSQVFVAARLIVRGDDVAFADEVTRTNNRQNRIENRDFVTLDPEQSRIRTELAIDGIEYQVMRSDATTRSDTAFDLVEATTALACASGTVRLPVQLKREIGKLWEDIGRPPYKELFNPSVPGLFVWRCVQIQRRIDRAIDTHGRRTGHHGRSALLTHGNRLVAALVFEALPVAQLRDPGTDLDVVASESIIQALVDRRAEVLGEQFQRHYPNSIVPTLFKNLSKCEVLARAVRTAI